MLGRHRQRQDLAGIEFLQPARPNLVIIPLRAPGDAAGKTRLQRGGARRIIAAERERHDANTFWIESIAGGQIFVTWCCIILGLGDQRQIAKTDALAVTRPVDDEAADPARSKIGDAIAILQLLSDVEAVKKYHCWRRARARCIV